VRRTHRMEGRELCRVACCFRSGHGRDQKARGGGVGRLALTISLPLSLPLPQEKQAFPLALARPSLGGIRLRLSAWNRNCAIYAAGGCEVSATALQGAAFGPVVTFGLGFDEAVAHEAVFDDRRFTHVHILNRTPFYHASRCTPPPETTHSAGSARSVDADHLPDVLQRERVSVIGRSPSHGSGIREL
jgi:hypothetical protein